MGRCLGVCIITRICGCLGIECLSVDVCIYCTFYSYFLFFLLIEDLFFVLFFLF